MRSYNNFWCCFNAQLCLSWMFPHHCHLFVCLHSVLQVVTIFTITNADFDNIQGELYQTTGHCLNLYIHCSYGCEMWYHSLVSFELTYIWLMCLYLRVNQMFMSVCSLVFVECVSWSSYVLSFLLVRFWMLHVVVNIVWKAPSRRKLKRLEAHKKGKRTEEEREPKRRQENSHRWATVWKKVRMSWYLGYIHEGRAGRKRAGMGSLDQGRGRRKPQRGGCPQCLASKRWNLSLQRWYTGISLSANPSANRVLNLTLMRMWNPNSKPQKYDPSHGADEKNVQHLECFVVGPKKSFQDSNLPRGPGLPCRCCERRTRPILSRLQKKA